MALDFPRVNPYELVLFFYPSPGLDWTSPRSLFLTTAKHTLPRRKRAIGHVSVLVRTPTEEVITGMTQANGGEGRREVLFRGYGLGILLHSFTGRIETTDDLAEELNERSKVRGKLSFLRMRVSPTTAERALAYHREFTDRKLGHSYGMRNRPRYCEGSGCSAFAASFLEVAGVLDAEIRREWTREFRIPRTLVGGPYGDGRRVSPLRTLVHGTRWANADEPHEAGFFWDPDLMHSWLERNFERVNKGGASELTVDRWREVHGLGVDRSASATPTDAFFFARPGSPESVE